MSSVYYFVSWSSLGSLHLIRYYSATFGTCRDFRTSLSRKQVIEKYTRNMPTFYIHVKHKIYIPKFRFWHINMPFGNTAVDNKMWQELWVITTRVTIYAIYFQPLHTIWLQFPTSWSSVMSTEYYLSMPCCCFWGFWPLSSFSVDIR